MTVNVDSINWTVALTRFSCNQKNVWVLRQERKTGRYNEVPGLEGSEERNLELVTKTAGRSQARSMLESK